MKRQEQSKIAITHKYELVMNSYEQQFKAHVVQSTSKAHNDVPREINLLY